MNKKIQIMRGLSIIAVIVIHTYNTNTYAWGDCPKTRMSFHQN